MKKFKTLEGQEFELYGEIEEYGILQREDDGLYELCDVSNENSFLTVRVVFENGQTFVDFDEPSEWGDDSIIVGKILD